MTYINLDTCLSLKHPDWCVSESVSVFDTRILMNGPLMWSMAPAD